MHLRSLVILWIAVGGVCVCGQTPVSAAPAFDVVSVKPADPNSRMTRLQLSPGRLSAKSAPLKLFIQMIYGLKAEAQMEGLPASIGSQKFDIEAKADEALQARLDKMSSEESGAVMNRMIQAMLEDRFQMKVSRQTRELPVYALVVAKGGPKIVSSATEPSTSGATAGNPAGAPGSITGSVSASAGGGASGGLGPSVRRLNASGSPISSLVSGLTRQPETGGRLVVDRTGLTGKYDWHLQWTPESASGSSTDEAAPSFFTAIQEQLGLKLEPSRGPVDILVIEHIELPSAN